MSLCLQQVGVYADDTSDDEGRIRSLLWRPASHLAKRRGSTSWFWTGKPAHIKDKEECCAFDAHSFHPFKNPSDMMKLHQQLFGDGDLGTSVEDKFLKKVKEHLLERSQDKSTSLRSN